MSFPETPNLPLDSGLPEGLAEAGVYSSERDAFQHGLAILAMGVPYWLIPYEEGYRLLVETTWLEASRTQLELFDRESRHWPPAPLAMPRPATPGALLLPLFWAIAVLAVFQLQLRWPGRLERLGTLDTARVFGSGELWRMGTSLFLHADVAHLTANLVSGFFVFFAVFTHFGRWRGAMLLALSSLAANAVVVSLAWSAEYRSLGASTAMFAGLGLLTGAAIRQTVDTSDRRRWQTLLTPLGAGVTLLCLFGAGGLHTDVAAHACGFVAGLLSGGAAGYSTRR